MKSSERAATLIALGLIAVFGALALILRPGLATAYASVGRKHTTVLLPAPELTVLMSLGYRSALADFLFAHSLVSYGRHFQEKRRFDLAASYLDTITTLDPKFREAYRLADTLIALQPVVPPLSVYDEARQIQDRGLENFPYDTELWLVEGQFRAYFAGPQFPPEQEAQWRMEGARLLARSCELIGSNENIPHHCVTAAVLYDEAGQKEAARGFLERVLAVSDDPEIHTLAGGYLGRIVGQAERDRAEERSKLFRSLWSKDLTFVSRDALLLIGPRFDTGLCSGRASEVPSDCVTSFRAWGEALDTR